MAEKSEIQNPKSNLAFVALGSNLGDSRRIIREAMAQLQKLSDEPIVQSSLWQTSPVNCPPASPRFINAVVGLAPRNSETPESMLKKLKSLENDFGREPKKVRNEPRSLDLDLIAFGAEMRRTPELILPHPRAHLRQFVLRPLNEIVPELILPGQLKTVSELLTALQNEEIVERLDG